MSQMSTSISITESAMMRQIVKLEQQVNMYRDQNAILHQTFSALVMSNAEDRTGLDGLKQAIDKQTVEINHLEQILAKCEQEKAQRRRRMREQREVIRQLRTSNHGLRLEKRQLQQISEHGQIVKESDIDEVVLVPALDADD